MKKISFLILIALFFVFFAAGEVKAGPEHNVWGWAWAGPFIGWASFNCYNDFDGDGIEDRENHCSGANYGVHICTENNDPRCAGMTGDKIGRLTGYAWMGSTNPPYGWIQFDPAPDFANYPGCGYPASPCYSACLDVPEEIQRRQGAGITQPCDELEDWEFGGWAKALTLNNWIQLRGSWHPSLWLNKDLSPREFEGVGWGGGEGGILAWLYFNCINCTLPTCPTSDFKVVTSVPPFPGNQAPVCDAGLDKEFFEGGSTVLEGSGSDPDGDPITFNWSCTSGSLDDSVAEQPTFTGPLGTYTCTLTVRDVPYGLTCIDDMIVRVKPQPLTVSCSASPNPARLGETVIFTSSISGDSYSWSGDCIGSEETCQTTFSQPGLYWVRLTVTSDGQSASPRSCSVLVLSLPTWREIPPTF